MFTLIRAAALAAAGTLLAGGGGLPAPAAASTTHSAHTTAQVVNARAGEHPTFDRIVFDVRGSLPDATVTAVNELRYDGSGQSVPLAGEYFLEIVLSPARAHNEAGKSVYQGPRLTTTRLARVKGIALTGDFEGYVTFGVALDKKSGWTTHRLSSPSRFVVDVRH